RKLSRYRLSEVPYSVIPNLFRDLGFGETVVGGIGLVVGKSKRHRLTVESFSVLGIKNLFFVDRNREARASRFRPGALSE
ncbi:MAG: hypothetical protein PWQ24_1736, partial [Mesotoga sp.]|nr:hypothetical protein [Mesotoga sp.]